MTGLWALLAAVVAAAVIGLALRYRDGRFRRKGDQPVDEAANGPLAAELAALGLAAGERATLLQFSSAFCAPCRATRVVLADVARVVPGVAHVEVDAEAHLELVRRLGIRRTPTVLVLDGAAREISRASGAPPSRAAVIAALGPAAASPDGQQ
ncbi:thioredoxin family protein [Frankia nepalensis]|uniref:thioredoxin family protein n=1 Tax=Frankia nepalensis TaxID=1836974 RepID=UPI0027DC0E56|nr:thioredoxin family protein [Frankia nepalensis]